MPEEKKCEYCQDGKSIANNYYADVSIYKNTLEVDLYEGANMIEQIHYCPMCGRKLEDK